MTTKTTDPKTDVSKRAEKRRRPMLRFAFWTFIGTAGVLTAAAGGAAWLVGTESGRSAALNLAVRFVPGFEAQAISGPWDDLTLKGIGWMSPGISAKIDELHLGCGCGTTPTAKTAFPTAQAPTTCREPWRWQSA